jgi:hypothetical protein
VPAFPVQNDHESDISTGSTLYIANDAFKDLDFVLVEAAISKNGRIYYALLANH